jgi:uncharacterized protein (DUF1330 family)
LPAYMVFTRLRMRDAAEMETYSNGARNSLGGHPAKVLAFYGAFEVAEGAGVDGMVILEFPTMAEAKAWYNSPAYVEARKHRFLGADYSVVFVEGVAAK